MLKNLGGAILLLSMAILMVIMSWKQEKQRVTVIYDCRMLMGNWHPDFPVAVIEECKKRIKQ
jgi:hypothetical protein